MAGEGGIVRGEARRVMGPDHVKPSQTAKDCNFYCE